MATYEAVHRAYYDFKDIENTKRVYSTSRVNRVLGMGHFALGVQLDAFVRQALEADSPSASQELLRSAISESTLGLAGLQRYAASQLNPFDVRKWDREIICQHSNRLQTARFLYGAVSEVPLSLAEPIGTVIEATDDTRRLRFALGSVGVSVYPLSREGSAATYEKAQQVIAQSDLDEGKIARIALTELEPEEVLHQVHSGKFNDIARDCDILMSARNISRSMYRFALMQTIQTE